MVDPTIQHKYISLIGDSLEGFKRLRGNVFNFRCPICGDSEKKNKKRKKAEKSASVFFFETMN